MHYSLMEAMVYSIQRRQIMEEIATDEGKRINIYGCELYLNA
jgi:hypothetical protein